MTEQTNAPDPRQLPDASGLRVGVLGGTGEQGRGLARRLALAGQSVVDRVARCGARRRDRGGGRASASSACRTRTARARRTSSSSRFRGRGTQRCSSRCATRSPARSSSTASTRSGSTSRVRTHCAVDEGSAAEQAAGILTDSRVVAAFHHISAVLLLDEAVDTIDTDVLVLGDDREATDLVQALAGRITGHPRALRRSAAQRRSGRGDDGEPDLDRTVATRCTPASASPTSSRGVDAAACTRTLASGDATSSRATTEPRARNGQGTRAPGRGRRPRPRRRPTARPRPRSSCARRRSA